MQKVAFKISDNLIYASLSYAGPSVPWYAAKTGALYQNCADFCGIYFNTFSLDFTWICKDLQAKP